MARFLIIILIYSFAWTAKAQHNELQLLINQKKYTEVAEYASRLTKSDSADIQTMYAIGQAYEGLLNYKTAYRYYQYSFSLDTTRIDLLNTIARTAAYIGKSKDAEAYFQKSLQYDSTDFYANYQLGRLYTQSGRNTDAITRFSRLLEQYPDNPVLLRSIGDCHSRMDNLLSATAFYLQSFELNKENATLAATLVNHLLLTQRADVALAICDTALLYNPFNLSLYQNKGLVLFTLKEYTQADEIYSSIIESGDSTYKTLKYGAISKYYAGKYMDAIEPLERAFQADSASVEVCLLLASALGRTYDRQKAFALFDLAESLMQPNQALVNMLKQFRAETLVRDGKINQAATLYYELWNDNKKPNYLHQIWLLYYDQSKVTDEEHRQRSLFINVLIANEYLQQNKEKGMQYQARRQLAVFHEDLFFRGEQEQTMLSPDNKKSTITLSALNELIQQLPAEMPKKDANEGD